MATKRIWIFKKIDEQQLIRVLGDDSAGNLARVFSRVESGRWSVKSDDAERFQLVENWLFERSESSRVFEASATEGLAPSRASSMRLAEAEEKSGGAAPHLSLVRPPPPPVGKSQTVTTASSDSDWLSALSASTRPATATPKAKEGFPTDDDPTNPGTPPPGEFLQLKSDDSNGGGEVIKLPINKKDKRRFARIEGRLRVVLISGKRSFRTHSVNLSKGGILLEHQIPLRLIGENCKVVIGSPDMTENLEFQARVVGANERPAALEFTDSKEEFLTKLESWLDKLKLKQAA